VPFLGQRHLPPHWQELFTHSSSNLLQDDPELASTISLGPEWTEPEGAVSDSEGAATTNGDPAMANNNAHASLNWHQDDPAIAQHDAMASPTPSGSDPAMTTDALASPIIPEHDPTGDPAMTTET
jgi:hypothetical protein